MRTAADQEGSERSQRRDAGEVVRLGEVVAGKYEITRIIGEGGMGVVAEARHLDLDGSVAIKFLSACRVGSGEATRRFAREARAAAKLKTEHVARVFDVGTRRDGVPYIVMELLEGETLAQQLLTEGPLTLTEAVDAILQTCECLAEAHSHGIVHRDIKPENLFLAQRPDGSELVKVLDFGLSKVGLEPAAATERLTGNRMMLGSLCYAPPEQLVAAKDVDARADVWALGVTLFELLTGRLPFGKNSFRETTHRILHTGADSLLEARPDLPPALEFVVRRCLSKDRRERYPTVSELALGLARFGPPGAAVQANRISRVLYRSFSGPLLGTGPITEELTEPASPHTETDPEGHVWPKPVPPSERYQVLLPLGRGGSARVLLAAARGPESINKLVVLKMLRRGAARDPLYRTMFLNEARLSSRLSHPNIVQVNDVFYEGEVPVLVMEYLEGQPLAAILSRVWNELPLPMHLWIISEMLVALHYAHELRDYRGEICRVIHRDVSPHNVIVTYQGVVKVLDFGIAKVAGVAGTTRTGVVKGKLRYMAPEQIAGEKALDHRADIFAAGVMLWEAITRQRLWHGVSDAEVVLRLRAGELPRPSELAPNCDPELERICMQTLSLKRGDRPKTAAALQAQVERVWRRMDPTLERGRVGEFVSRHFAEDQARMRLHIEQELKRVQPLPRSSGARVMVHPKLSASTQRSAVRTTRRPRANVITLGLVATSAATSLAVLAFTVLSSKDSPEPVSGPAAGPPALASQAPTPLPSALPRVTLTLRARPPTARLYQDGKLLPSNPYVIEAPSDGTVHSIAAQAPGFTTEIKEAVVDRNQTVEFDLVPLGAESITQSGDNTLTSSEADASDSAAGADRPNPRRRSGRRRARRGCEVPYYIDSKGIKRFRRECL